MESYHALRLAVMPINAVFVLRVISTTESLLLGYCPESTRRSELVEF
jgi:hypothetical protein